MKKNHRHAHYYDYYELLSHFYDLTRTWRMAGSFPIFSFDDGPVLTRTKRKKKNQDLYYFTLYLHRTPGTSGSPPFWLIFSLSLSLAYE